MIEIWTYAVGLRIFGFCGCTPPPPQWLHTVGALEQSFIKHIQLKFPKT